MSATCSNKIAASSAGLDAKEASHLRTEQKMNVPTGAPKSNKGRFNKASQPKKKSIHHGDAPSDIKFVVVGTGAQGSPPALLLVMNSFRYLFNCGEGTQRIISEQKGKPSRLERVFITHRNWTNIGGLLGMLLTVDKSDATQSTVTIHGPPDTDKIVLHARNFGAIVDTKLCNHTANDGPHSDGAMKIDHIEILPQQSTRSPPMQPTATATGSPQDEVSDVESTYCDTALAFFCKPHHRPRTLSLERCLELGVPKGPMLAELKKGKTITLEDGRMVTPEEVLFPHIPTQPFIVLECPTLSHIDSLVNNHFWKKYQQQPPDVASAESGSETTTQDDDFVVDIIVHFSSCDVLADSRYQQWMRSFGSRTKHLLLNAQCSGVILEAVYRLQTRLNIINPLMFPMLHEQQQQVDHCKLDVDNVTWAKTGLIYVYRGAHEKNYKLDSCVQLDYEEYKSAAMQNIEKSNVQIKPPAASQEKSYPEVVFLGTGSSTPARTRNVSAILLNLSSTKSILLDCGEGTLGQLARFYGPTQLQHVLVNLSAVFISHLHADHHMGLVGLLEARNEAIRSIRGADAVVSPLPILAPHQIMPWHQDIEKLLPYSVSKNLLYITTSCLCASSEDHSLKNRKQVCDIVSVKDIETVFMYHRQVPFGIILWDQHGHKIAYSGDTMPCDRFIKAGINSDLLIHEATLEDYMIQDAKEKRHSTVAQAIKVGRDMKAKFTLLTHFSQRYDTLPVTNEQCTDSVGIAFDNMCVSLSEVHELPKLLPALQVLFAEKVVEMKQRTEKRKQKKMYKDNLQLAEKLRKLDNSSAAKT